MLSEQPLPTTPVAAMPAVAANRAPVAFVASFCARMESCCCMISSDVRICSAVTTVDMGMAPALTYLAMSPSANERYRCNSATRLSPLGGLHCVICQPPCLFLCSSGCATPITHIDGALAAILMTGTVESACTSTTKTVPTTKSTQLTLNPHRPRRTPRFSPRLYLSVANVAAAAAAAATAAETFGLPARLSPPLLPWPSPSSRMRPPLRCVAA